MSNNNNKEVSNAVQVGDDQLDDTKSQVNDSLNNSAVLGEVNNDTIATIDELLDDSSDLIDETIQKLADEGLIVMKYAQLDFRNRSAKEAYEMSRITVTSALDKLVTFSKKSIPDGGKLLRTIQQLNVLNMECRKQLAIALSCALACIKELSRIRQQLRKVQVNNHTIRDINEANINVMNSIVNDLTNLSNSNKNLIALYEEYGK